MNQAQTTNSALLAVALLSAPAAARAQAPQPPIVRVEVTGARSLKPEDVAGAALRAVRGRPGDDASVRAAAEAATALYRRKGFSIAQVVGTEVTPDGTLKLLVAEGTIRRIVVRGNTRTRERVVLAALSVREGDAFRETTLREARNRIARLGVFEDVIISPSLDAEGELREEEERLAQEKAEQEAAGKDPAKGTPPPPPTVPPPTAPPPIGQGTPAESAGDATASRPPANTPPVAEPPAAAEEVGFVDLVVRVRERRTGNVALTLGYADQAGLTGFVDVSEQNLDGNAQRVSLQWQRFNQGRIDENGFLVDEGTRSAYGVSFEQPFLGPGSLSFAAELYDKNTIFLPFFWNNQETIRNYEVRRGGRLRVGRAFGRTAAFLSARRDDVGYDGIPARLNPPLSALRDADAVVAALGITLQNDGRDEAANPRTGYLYSVSYERAGSYLGGDRNFGQVSLDLRQYIPLGPARAGGGGARARTSPVLALRALGGTSQGSVPLSEQFWLGGFELLRGYDLYSIRGDRMLLFSAEGRIPLGNGVQGVVLSDFGNAWEPGRRLDFGDMKASIGAGLRFLTPIGPIRLDVAYGSRLQTYVSLGQSY